MTENCWTEDGDRGLIIAAHDKKLSGKHYEKCFRRYYLPTPPLGQDITQGQFLSGV